MSEIKDSELKMYSRCPYSLHLKRLGLKQPPSGIMALSSYFNRQRTSLFDISDSKIGEIFPNQHHAGPKLLTPEEMTPEELRLFLKFQSPECFGDYLKVGWLNRNPEFHGQETLWLYESERYYLSKSILLAGKNYYEMILDNKNGVPIFGYMDKDLNLDHNGHRITVSISEIHSGARIFDIGLWRFNQQIPGDDIKGLNESSLVTLKLLLMTELLKQEFFRLKFKIDEKTAETSCKINPNLVYYHFNCTKDKLTSTRRTDADISKLDRGLDAFLERAQKNIFPFNLRNCNLCPYNSYDSQMERLCRKCNPQTRPLIPARYFKKRTWQFRKETLEGTTIASATIDDHVVAQLTITPDKNERFSTLFPHRELELEKRLKKLL